MTKNLRVHFETTTSTMDEARNFVERGIEDLEEIDLVVITADQQTSARGQYGKVWSSPPGAGI